MLTLYLQNDDKKCQNWGALHYVNKSIINVQSFQMSHSGADYMSWTGLVEGLALSAEMTAQPGIT